MPHSIVIDTNVLYAALRSRRGESRRLLDAVFEGAFTPHVSVPLVPEYEAVLVCEPHPLHFRWPVHVRDPGDAHVLNTAVAASCPDLITFNNSDFHQAWSLGVTLLTPRELRMRIRSST